jgi:hypothetical protein
MNDLNAKTEGWDQEAAPQEVGADTHSEPTPGPDCAMTIMDLFDAGWGKHMVPVTAPGGAISPTSSLARSPKSMGKAPGMLTQDGWIGVSVNKQKFRCRDRVTAELWTSWSANAGFVAGEGYVALDNDQGEILDRIIAQACLRESPKIELLRRSVASPGHKRSAFLLRVMDLDSNTPVAVGNRTLKFECTGVEGELQVLGWAKQLVVSGVHPGTGAAYVLSKRAASLADIPVLSAEQLDRIIEGVIAEMQAHGWALVSGGGAAGAGPKFGAGAAGDGDFEEVAWILARLPNRDVPTDKETKWDKFIDDYDEYIKVLYAIFGALGAPPEVTTLAMDWANGRAQPGQKPEDAWASIVSNPVRSGMYHLKRLAWRFIGAEYIARQFPEDEVWREAQAASTAPGNPADAPGGGIWTEWRAALERLRTARPAPIFSADGWAPHLNITSVLILDAEDVGPVPLRPDMTDRHTRAEAAMLVGSGGGGKSTLSTNNAIAIAYENPAVIGQASVDWCGDVIIVSNEENHQTVRRRIRALRSRMGLSPKDQKHRIVIWRDTLVLGRAVDADGVAPTRAAIAFVNNLAQLNAESEIALIVLDTLASLFSGLNENSVQMEKAVGMLADIAKAGFFAVDIMHHASKAQDGRETATSFRGSSAIGAKVREHSTIVPVPKDEWPAFGWTDAEGARTVRVSGQKANDKPIAGAWCFRWELRSVVAYDVRNPSDPKSATTGILLPLGKPTAKRVAPQAALRALYAFHQNGGKIVRGGANGPVAPHHAHRILIDAGLGDRKAAEALIVELLKEKLLTRQQGWVRGHNVTFLIPSEPEEEEV